MARSDNRRLTTSAMRVFPDPVGASNTTMFPWSYPAITSLTACVCHGLNARSQDGNPNSFGLSKSTALACAAAIRRDALSERVIVLKLLDKVAQLPYGTVR